MFKGWPLQDAPSKLVQLWYKSFPPGRFLPGKNEEANHIEQQKQYCMILCGESDFGWIFENKILGTGFEIFELNDN